MLKLSIFRVFFVLFLSAAVHGEGACSIEDQSDTIKRVSPTFVKNWEKCGWSTLAMTDAFNKCLQAEHANISSACINCFGKFVGCTRLNCLFSCMGFTAKWCEKCALDNCQASLIECTGVSKENLPSKYPKTAAAETESR